MITFDSDCELVWWDGRTRCVSEFLPCFYKNVLERRWNLLIFRKNDSCELCLVLMRFIFGWLVGVVVQKVEALSGSETWSLGLGLLAELETHGYHYLLLYTAVWSTGSVTVDLTRWEWVYACLARSVNRGMRWLVYCHSVIVGVNWSLSCSRLLVEAALRYCLCGGGHLRALFLVNAGACRRNWLTWSCCCPPHQLFY